MNLLSFLKKQKLPEGITCEIFECKRDGLTIRGTEYRPQGENLPIAIVCHGFMAFQDNVKHYTIQLADSIFDYFPNATHLAVAVDGSVMTYEKWRETALNRWHAPKEICERLVTDDITIDSLIALHKKRGNSVQILFDCAVRDSALTKVQAYLNGYNREPLKEDGDAYQRILKSSMVRLQQEVPDVGIYIFEKISDKETQLMQHTILFTPFAFQKLSGDINPVQWVYDSMYGEVKSYGIELLDKEY